MALPPVLRDRLRLPVIGSPLFIISNPDLVIAQCKAGIVGAFPALNARPVSMLDEWLHRITEELAAWDRDHPEAPSAPFAVNHIVHKSNDRLQTDVELTTKWKVPIIIRPGTQSHALQIAAIYVLSQAHGRNSDLLRLSFLGQREAVAFFRNTVG